MTTQTPRTIVPERAIRTQRIIWGGILAGPMLYGLVVYMALLWQQQQREKSHREYLQRLQEMPELRHLMQTEPKIQPPANADLLLGICAAAMLIIPVVYVVRKIHFDRRRKDGVLSPGAYANGNIIYWGGCEMTAFIMITLSNARHTIWPTYILVGIALLAQAMVFPRLSAIKPRPDTFQME